MTLHKTTIETALSETQWLTAGQVAQYLRQCGPLAFHDEAEYKDFRYATKARQYSAVYNALLRLRGICVDSCFGADDGKETRVFMLVHPIQQGRL